MTKNNLYLLGEYKVGILIAEITLSTINGVDKPDPFGPVSSGSLQLCGRWISADEWPNIDKTPWNQTVLSNESLEGFIFYNFDNGKPEDLFKIEQEHRILSLFQIAKWADRPDSPGEMCALILESTPKKVDEFRRVGVARLFQMDDSWLESWETKTVTIT